MRQKTLQEQYNLIKEGKGNKEIFLKEAKRQFPNLISKVATYNQATNRLKQKAVITESVLGLGMIAQPKKDPDWFKIFEEKAKGWNAEADLPPNVEGERFLQGYYAEMKNPKNANKTIQQVKDIVYKNLYKNKLYYIENYEFGIDGVGYTKDAPGLKVTQIKGKNISSGYGNPSKSKIKPGEPGTGYLPVKENKTPNKTKNMISLVNLLTEGKSSKKIKELNIKERIKEIEKKGSVAALEAKMNAIDEEIELREGKLRTVSENEALSEFVNPARVNEIKKEIKELTRANTKYGKMYERMTGKAYVKPEVVGEMDGQSFKDKNGMSADWAPRKVGQSLKEPTNEDSNADSNNNSNNNSNRGSNEGPQGYSGQQKFSKKK